MSQDPYHDVKVEVESTLQTLTTLHSSYIRILSTLPSTRHSGSEELTWALSELKATLSALEADREELDESVRVLEGYSDRGMGLGIGAEAERIRRNLGVGEEEVRRRREFVDNVGREIEKVRRSIASTSTDNNAGPSRYPPKGVPPRHGMTYPPNASNSNPNSKYGYRNADDDLEKGDDDDDDPQADFEREQQQLLLSQQDNTLDTIGGTVRTLREQADVMGREIVDQTGMIGDLTSSVDRSQSRLRSASAKMAKFIKEERNSPSSWCILFLIIILFILLLVIIFL